MKILEPEIQQKINKLLKDLDLRDLYKKYEWKGDSHSNGFPDLFRLETEISDAARKNSIMQHHLVDIAKWGKLRNTKKISCQEPIKLTLYVNNLPASWLATEPENAISILDAQVKGFGPTYASKILHFAVPQIFGALDTRLVRIFGNSAPKYYLLNLVAEKSGDRWLIPPSQTGWPGEYGIWIGILKNIADRLNEEHKFCPHPQKYLESGLREEGIWLPADVETALFSYASQEISETSLNSKRLSTRRRESA